jgi:hypothetical protein
MGLIEFVRKDAHGNRDEDALDGEKGEQCWRNQGPEMHVQPSNGILMVKSRKRKSP